MSDRVILVTGANSGIIDAVQVGNAKIETEKGVNVKYVQLDVTDIESVQTAEKIVKDAEGRLNVLINKHWHQRNGKLQVATEVDVAVLRAAFEPNFFGLVQATTTFLSILRLSSTPDEPSVILNSPRGFLHNLVAYNTSKAAVNSYTIALVQELKELGIKVNCATPGLISTALSGWREGGRTPAEAAETLVEWSLLGKEGKTGVFVNETDTEKRTFIIFNAGQPLHITVPCVEASKRQTA
ncbi:hypothetical protein C8R43DRAFT_1106869 [Mycena crocata]|nr:hypothetical protein C8R43DRAFT_1106869 [Mycena crocata]